MTSAQIDIIARKAGTNRASVEAYLRGLQLRPVVRAAIAAAIKGMR